MNKNMLLATVLGAAAGLTILAAAESPPAAAPAAAPSPFSGPNGTPGGPRQYEVDELTPIVNRALRGGRNYENGKKAFSDVGCTICHLFGGGTGGIGPDLSGVGGRFGTREILESIIEPSAVVSDLYGTKIIETKDGKTVSGKLASEGEDEVSLVQNYTVDPNSMTASWSGGSVVKVKTADIVWMEESPTSLMPPALINGLKEDAIADMFAYMISGGDPGNRMFKPLAAPAAPAAK
jgi:putative heme-binding domain-containing protein